MDACIILYITYYKRLGFLGNDKAYNYMVGVVMVDLIGLRSELIEVDFWVLIVRIRCSLIH